MVTKEEQIESDEEIIDNDEPKMFKKTCPYCKKTFYSLSEKQLAFNYTSHIGSCKFKSEKKKEAEVKKK